MVQLHVTRNLIEQLFSFFLERVSEDKFCGMTQPRV